MGANKIDCDFEKFQQSNNAGLFTMKDFESLSVSTIFYVQKNQTFASTDTPIPFEIATAFSFGIDRWSEMKLETEDMHFLGHSHVAEQLMKLMKK